MALTITNDDIFNGTQRPVGIKVVTNLTATEKWVECKLYVGGSLLTTFNSYFNGSSYLYVYPQRIIDNLYSIELTKLSTTAFKLRSDDELMKIWYVEFTEKYLDSGTVTTGDSATSDTYYSIDARRNIEKSNLSDYVADGSTGKFLTDRTTIQLNSGDWYPLYFVSSVDITAKTYEGATEIDSKDLTITGDYDLLFYNIIGGSSDRTVKIYEKGKTALLFSMTIKARKKCNSVRVLYRNRLGGYDMDYISKEEHHTIDRTLFEKDLPFDYTYYSDRSLTQVARKETEAGEIYTEKMSDLHAYQIATSKDVYIYDGSTAWLFKPIIITDKKVISESFGLKSFKFNFKYSNI